MSPSVGFLVVALTAFASTDAIYDMASIVGNGKLQIKLKDGREITVLG
jgi:hypothetical protein